MANNQQTSGRAPTKFIRRSFGGASALVNETHEHLIKDFSPEEFTLRSFVQNHEQLSSPIGRGKIALLKSSTGERFVLRQYLRGGFVRRFLTDQFLRRPFSTIENSRPFRELEILGHLLDSGVSVPVPVLGISSISLTGLSYRAAIMTEYLPDTKNLLVVGRELLKTNQRAEDFKVACFKAGVQALKMLKNGVFHPDLHLGNVLVDAEDRVYLIDFDQAERIAGDCSSVAYRERVIDRWGKSANKHELITIALQPFVEGLYTN